MTLTARLLTLAAAPLLALAVGMLCAGVALLWAIQTALDQD